MVTSCCRSRKKITQPDSGDEVRFYCQTYIARADCLGALAPELALVPTPAKKHAVSPGKRSIDPWGFFARGDWKGYHGNPLLSVGVAGNEKADEYAKAAASWSAPGSDVVSDELRREASLSHDQIRHRGQVARLGMRRVDRPPRQSGSPVTWEPAGTGPLRGEACPPARTGTRRKLAGRYYQSLSCHATVGSHPWDKT